MALVTRFAPALLASVVAALGIAAAHAETPTPPAASDCLAKPNGPSAEGSHWYYHVEHPSGRHCWYQRPIDSANEAQPHAPAAQVTPPPLRTVAPVAHPAADTSTQMGLDTADGGASVVPPIAAPPAAPATAPAAPPFGLFGAAVIPPTPPAVAPNAALPPLDSAAPPPVVAPVMAPKADRSRPQLDTVASNGIAARPRSLARPDTPAELGDPDTHVPALLGTVSALVIIILGSFVGQFLANRRRRRERIAARAANRQPAVSRMEASPGIVPIMPGRGDVAREGSMSRAQPRSSPDEWGLRRRRTPPGGSSRDTARVLEDNVRELLGRLKAELRVQPGVSAARRAAVAAPHVPTTQELDAVLAIWRAKRGG